MIHAYRGGVIGVLSHILAKLDPYLPGRTIIGYSNLQSSRQYLSPRSRAGTGLKLIVCSTKHGLSLVSWNQLAQISWHDMSGETCDEL